MLRHFSSILALTLFVFLGVTSRTSRAAAPSDLGPSSIALRAASQVDSARIFATICSLSTNESGEPVSRYAERPETRLIYAEMIKRFLRGGPETQLIEFQSTRTETTQYNVVRVIPGVVAPSPGLVLLTAHYDAVGNRTPGGWDPFVDPAPGADDNASGVACLVEAAHVLEGLALPFDVALVAFGSEEAFGPPGAGPLEGSRVLTSDLDQRGDPILAAFNCDMVAYNPKVRKLDIVANAPSRWMADLIVETGALTTPELILTPILTNPPLNSDHASFWAQDEDAVNVIENKTPNIPDSLHEGNPFYHTTSDTLGNLNFGLAADAARLVVASVARLATPPPGPPDILVDSAHIMPLPKKAFIGDRISVEVRAYNRGGVIPNGSGSARLELWIGDPGSGGRMLEAEEIDLPIAPWFYKRAVFTWPVEEKDVGVTSLVARVSASGLGEADLGNNEARREVLVHRNEVSAVRAVTNPIHRDRAFDELRFEFEVPLRPSVLQDVEATVYDINGRRVAHHAREGAQDGRNFLLWRNFDVVNGGDLPSGVYLVDVRLLDRANGAEVSKAAGKFVFQH